MLLTERGRSNMDRAGVDALPLNHTVSFYSILQTGCTVNCIAAPISGKSDNRKQS